MPSYDCPFGDMARFLCFPVLLVVVSGQHKRTETGTLRCIGSLERNHGGPTSFIKYFLTNKFKVCFALLSLKIKTR